MSDDLAARLKAHAAPVLPKRFYERAEVVESGGGFGVELDGRPLRTPLKAPLVVPARDLAEALAVEWRDQSAVVDARRMHLTRLANTAIDLVENDRIRVADEIVAYAGGDLVCYRAEGPPALCSRQAAAWDPPLDWAHTALGARFVLAQGVVHHPQPSATLDAIASHLKRLDAFTLTALHNMTTLTGSAVLALAVAEGVLSPEQAWAAAHVDEDWQSEQWGGDAEAEARRAERWREFDSAVRLLRLSA